MISRANALSQSLQDSLKSSSVIRKIFLLGQKRRSEFPDLETIDLSLGNPDLEPPVAVLDAMKHLVTQSSPGMHRYMDNAGYPEVRAALAAKLSQSEKVQLTSDNVFLTCGAAGALHVLMRSILDPGDEVLLLAPYFVEYTTYASVHGARTVIVPLESCAPGTRKSFVPSISMIEKHLTKQSKILIINSPNNPSGALYPKSFYEDLANLLTTHRQKTGRSIHVIADEPYARVCFPPSEHTPPLSFFELAWLVRSHSKDLGLAGDRIGYIAWPQGDNDAMVIDALRTSARALGFVNAPALMQRLLPMVFEAKVDISIYQKRAQIFSRMMKSGGFHLVEPEGTFFVLPETPEGYSDTAFCEAAAQQGVLIVPAAAFGAPGHFRVSLTQDIKLIERAADILISTINN